jgi:hypothetical protein
MFHFLWMICFHLLIIKVFDFEKVICSRNLIESIDPTSNEYLKGISKESISLMFSFFLAFTVCDFFLVFFKNPRRCSDEPRIRFFLFILRYKGKLWPSRLIKDFEISSWENNCFPLRRHWKSNRDK